jgi:virginiamycin B lyase
MQFGSVTGARMQSFAPKTEKFESFPLRDPYASVRQLAGRKGEIWGAESGADKLFVLKAE